jgi:chemotaxis protein methyltransferase CheR
MTASQFQTAPDDVELEIDLLLEAIFRKYSYDFRHYARASMRRRTLLALGQFGMDSVSQMQHAVLRDPGLFTALLAHLTIPVSDMFRDPAYFVALREHALPILATYPSLKVWVAGCSTGEEAYSLAILLDETGLLKRTLIYATDINPGSLRTAERGVYGLDRIAGFTRNYQAAGGVRSLSDYYTAAYSGAAFDRRLAASIVFADHCLATDTAFAEVQLVSCRNVLIYFDRTLQGRAIGLFRDALVRRGFLGLGSHEAMPELHAPGFETVDAHARLYRSL